MEERHDDIKHEHRDEGKEVHRRYNEKLSKKIILWQTATAVLGILLIISLFTGGFALKGGTQETKKITIEEAADKTISYLNTRGLKPGLTAKLLGSEEKNKFYNIKVEIDGKNFIYHVTKDGSLLFTSMIDMTKEIEKPETETQQTPASVEKSDKPTVELFVTSHNLFAIQAEKGIIPVVELLGNKIDFEVKFLDYTMYGEKEVKEQLIQHCIKTEQSDKFLGYLKCFLASTEGSAEESVACLKKVGVDIDKLDACKSATDKEFKITANLENKSIWISGKFPPFLINNAECKQYNLRDSPNLVVDGELVSSARSLTTKSSPKAFLAIICNAFNEPPTECEQELDSANPLPEFGYQTPNKKCGG